MNSYVIYNKSSERMSEVSDQSVDLIVTSPPYNIGTTYGNNSDKLSLEEYEKLLGSVFSECVRTLKTDGVLVLECADSILSNGVFIQLAGYIQALCVGSGLTVTERHFNFVHTKNGMELPENEKWNKHYQTTEDNHSNCHQLVVFSKKAEATFNPKGEILYVEYVAKQGHPCPIPEGIYDFLLKKYFKTGMAVMDPFMGTGILGTEVVARGGTFVGYELDSNIFQVAKNNFGSGSKM